MNDNQFHMTKSVTKNSAATEGFQISSNGWPLKMGLRWWRYVLI